MLITLAAPFGSSRACMALGAHASYHHQQGPGLRVGYHHHVGAFPSMRLLCIRASHTQSALDSVTLPTCKRTPRSWNWAVFATRLQMQKQGKRQPVFNWRIAFGCTPACLGVILGHQPSTARARYFGLHMRATFPSDRATVRAHCFCLFHDTSCEFSLVCLLTFQLASMPSPRTHRAPR
jgi:hypothetical protein